MYDKLVQALPLPSSLKQFLLSEKQKIYFLLVGASAAAVHWLIAVGYFVVINSQATFIANLCGFLVALGVSLFGHTFLTFGQEYAQKQEQVASKSVLLMQTFAKQGLVALASFGLNNLLMYIGTWLGIWFPVLLFVVLVLVAMITFVLSKYWVYRN